MRQRIPRTGGAARGRTAGAGRDRNDRARAQRPAVHHGWSVRGNERAACRVLSPGRARSERGDSHGVEDSAGARGKHRGSTGARIGAVKRVLLVALLVAVPAFAQGLYPRNAPKQAGSPSWLRELATLAPFNPPRLADGT